MILSCLEIDIEKRPKFSDIERSWYFRKLFSSETSSVSFNESVSYRSPLKNINSNIDIFYTASQNEKRKKNEVNHTVKSPTFSRINKLKSDIKRKK